MTIRVERKLSSGSHQYHLGGSRHRHRQRHHQRHRQNQHRHYIRHRL